MEAGSHDQPETLGSQVDIIAQRSAVEPAWPESLQGPGVLLFSAGVESSALLHFLHAQQIQPIFLDYAQRSAPEEWRHAHIQCARLGQQCRRYHLADLGEQIGALRPHRYHVPVPHRNLLALSVAASVAASLNLRVVYMGLTADDALVDRASSAEFRQAMTGVLQTLGLTLVTPLAAMSKAAVVRWGTGLGVPWKMSYSCLLGRQQHCGQCPQCLKRQAAFAAAGARAEDVYYARPAHVDTGAALE